MVAWTFNNSVQAFAHFWGNFRVLLKFICVFYKDPELKALSSGWTIKRQDLWGVLGHWGLAL